MFTAQVVKDAVLYVGVFVVLVLALEVHRRVERARVARHPSAAPTQGSCVRIYRSGPRPFDHERDS